MSIDHKLQFIRPPRLRQGSRVAALSLSSGLVSEAQNRYEAGVRAVARYLGWEIVASPNAFRGSDYLYANPQARADDLHWALEHPEIEGMLSIIGGDDSIRLVPLLSREKIRQHPKVLLGYSDTTVSLLQFLRAGVMAYHGPALLTDLAEPGGMRPEVARSVRQAMMDDPQPYLLEPAAEWSEFRQKWDAELQDKKRPFQPSEGPVWLQGAAPAEGHLIGGCAEILDMLSGTPGWPEPELWRSAVLVLETSEDVPPPAQVGYWLRNFAAQGILGQLSGLMLARPKNYTADMTKWLYTWVLKVLAEAGRTDLPVVANLDIGHTSPQLTLPLGAAARLDPKTRQITITP